MKFATRSKAGQKGTNQDAFATPPKGIDTQKYGICLAVADGITLCPKGGELAEDAVKIVELYYKEAVANGPGKEALAKTLDLLWENFFKRVEKDNDEDYLVSGTTLTIALIYQNEIHIMHLGDSHCDLFFEDGTMKRLTEEHNSEDGALLNYFGGELQTPAQEETHPFPEGTKILLTTDGISYYVDGDLLAYAVQELHKSPQKLLDELFNRADECGSTDDKTAVFGF